MLTTALTILIALVCLLLIGVILIQNPKGGGVDSTFGGVQANQMLGASRSTEFIEKVTWGLVIALFVLCIVTALVTGTGSADATLTPLQSQ